LLDRGKRF